MRRFQRIAHGRADRRARQHGQPRRVFEAASAGACLITDYWEGIELFLAPGEEVLVRRAPRRALDERRAAEIGQAALRRVLAEHTYEKRAIDADAVLREALARRRERVPA